MIAEYTDDELRDIATGSVLVFDVECYPNYFLIAFKNIVNKKHVFFELSPDSQIDMDKLRFLIWRVCLVGFNSNSYDMVMMTAALWGFNNRQLKDLSDDIIFREKRPYHIQKEYGLEIPCLNHVDIIEVAPLMASLKVYAGRLHCKTMRELPYPHDTDLTRAEAANVKEYCVNDLDNTELVLCEVAPHIELRQDLGRAYGRDFRSLSDAQVAEAIVNNEMHKVTGFYPRAPKAAVEACRYNVPSYIKFSTPLLQKALSVVANAVFPIDGAGSPQLPEELKKLSIRIGNSTYKLGMGGLHSQESEVEYIASDDVYIIDRDVASYYPRIVLNQRLYPKHLGEIFLTIYESIVDRRLAAKKQGNKKVSEGLKIAINGIFGKFGNIYSSVYAPDLMLQVTISGQLSLLMLIEMIELAGIPVVSGNTDGVVIYCPKDRYEDLLSIVQLWEKLTGFETEETRYKKLNSRDVNNYIAVKEKPDPKGKYLQDRLGIKAKGVYSEFGSAQNSVLSKNPETLICNDAVMRLIAEGVPLRQTIKECKDIRRFTSMRNVKGGAVKNGVYLGKAVRWYYAKAEVGAITYQTGNKVAKSEGAKPLMVLPDVLPSDIDYDWYEREATEMLFDLNVYKKASTLSFF